MPNMMEVKIPDIGDFTEVAVIEVMVKPGDTIKPEDPLITLESDKATMDVPSPAGGLVKDVKLKVGDKVAQGTLILLLETAEVAAAAPAPAQPAPKAEPAAPAKAASAAAPKFEVHAAEPAPAPRTGPLPGAATYTGKIDGECEVLVLGAGPGGYSAAFRAADLGKKTVLVERYATLGGVCLNVGCIPSKALLHVAAVTEEAQKLVEHGVSFGAPKFDLARLRAWKDKVVGKLVGGIGIMAKGRKVEVIRGIGRFIDPHHMEIALTAGEGKAPTGEKKIIRFAHAIIAAGSQSVKLPFIPEDPRIVDSTGAIELRAVPKRMLVIGGGIIGLEMATVYSALGCRIDVVEMLDGLMLGADRDLVRVWDKMNAHRFDRIMLKTRTTKVEATKNVIKVTFEGEQAPDKPQVYDLVLVAAGRAPNGKNIDAGKAGIAVTDRGFIEVDKQMRTNVPHIFAIGDIVGQPMLAHKAVHEGHVAAEAAAGQKSFFDAAVIPSVAYTDPEIAWVGVTEDEAKKQGRAVGKARFPWVASGRAIANGRDEGLTKIIVDEETHRVIGGGIVGTNAGDLISELALAIEMGCDPADIGKTIHPHPTLGESVGMVAEVYEGVCTDLMPQKRR
ncbi:dihydrolipoamide dehydrogenase [Sulfuricaulis limicola]|uniref:Dihydrolipoyl dehydrogenase n=1 Tax=Sulfuricaulis limicola TaxID=1620215 RepID=A0A1B4XE90_9GAMM|nr:dihydrolipoamide dehydrogenase [Sulfuricaulis limicola]